MSRSENECEILRAQVIELQRNLQDAQDFIFSRQPRQQKLTETEAAEDFNTLCGSIEEWVDTKLGDALEEKTPTKARLHYTSAKMFLSLIPNRGREAFKYPETDMYNITAAILRFLCNEIFNIRRKLWAVRSELVPLELEVYSQSRFFEKIH